MEKPIEGTHTTLAVGKRSPDVSRYLHLDGVGAKVPLGKLKSTAVPDTEACIWTMKGTGWRATRVPLDPIANTMVERARLDPQTTFPCTVVVTHRDQKYTVVLDEGYDTTTATMCGYKENKQPKKKKASVDGEKGSRQPDKTTGGIDKDGDSGISSSSNSESADSDGATNMRNALTGHRSSEPGKELKRTIRQANPERNEFVVYDTTQIKLRYLIEVTSKQWLANQLQ
ncbi:hypothetical protein SARC_00418 [Sphaeroforma arctica JP610]|uniref:Uncharacterized protein n=1 Tax=Sphaeroforma arctica JP610 TaxID=667725 RepID=A0A0L0GF33_9EUKA|nr:hypothetical protein SARC_00418 [Sphaeroforma arctica JP610]KNC87484.1 hypothetical protein SARC_00418 [Sphaeroforma arctica JP610]|eukprot:XP_014161386.1 hypothetical protein SARC_00418 [Sphaeroforma arctica JP610]